MNIMKIMRDSEIEQSVLRGIQLLELVDGRQMCVVSREGVVTLDGTVQNQRSKLAIHTAARDANGVIALINNLQLSSSEASAPCFAAPGKAKISRAVSAQRPVRRGASRRALATY